MAPEARDGRPAADAFRSSLVRAVPATLAVPIILAAILVAAGVRLEPVPLAIGAFGWIVALVLRAPIALAAVARTGDPERAQPWIVAASGPLEEAVRLAIVLLLAADPSTALSVGLGWAAVEVAYAIVNGFALLALLGRTDPEAERARALLPFRSALEPAAPWWGVVERAWASVLHIAFTAIVAAAPPLVVATIVAHSATNLSLVRAGRRGASLAAVSAAGIAIASAAALVAARLVLG